ncbi:hypothetical protein [Planktothrix mougeotii]|uniref:CopG family transcriptional regulator n=1 Tax=Planktothrix mougeotii LEGE 06226 TaxID=1828728 RepID=A0ABR9UIZ0_9CYAN|nr:hypothetical protein [Planktothrix mougeotii]MBE9146412.1 hypothetical protein [Planktothrix mougeotii LEGE 06226]
MPRPKGESKVICFYVAPETHKAIRRVALDRDTTLQDLLLGMVERELSGGTVTQSIDVETEATILKAVKGEKLADVELALLADALNLDQRKLTQSRDKNNGHKHNGSPCHS